MFRTYPKPLSWGVKSSGFVVKVEFAYFWDSLTKQHRLALDAHLPTSVSQALGSQAYTAKSALANDFIPQVS